MSSQDDVREFLATRRARITPQQAGLASYGRRRVTGLRREEVAMLAGVSTDSAALLAIVGQDEPPLRFVAGSDAIEAAEGKARELLAQARASRDLGANLTYDAAVI